MNEHDKNQQLNQVYELLVEKENQAIELVRMLPLSESAVENMKEIIQKTFFSKKSSLILENYKDNYLLINFSEVPPMHVNETDPIKKEVSVALCQAHIMKNLERDLLNELKKHYEEAFLFANEEIGKGHQIIRKIIELLDNLEHLHSEADQLEEEEIHYRRLNGLIHTTRDSNKILQELRFQKKICNSLSDVIEKAKDPEERKYLHQRLKDHDIKRRFLAEEYQLRLESLDVLSESIGIEDSLKLNDENKFEVQEIKVMHQAFDRIETDANQSQIRKFFLQLAYQKRKSLLSENEVEQMISQSFEGFVRPKHFQVFQVTGRGMVGNIQHLFYTFFLKWGKHGTAKQYEMLLKITFPSLFKNQQITPNWGDIPKNYLFKYNKKSSFTL